MTRRRMIAAAVVATLIVVVLLWRHRAQRPHAAVIDEAAIAQERAERRVALQRAKDRVELRARDAQLGQYDPEHVPAWLSWWARGRTQRIAGTVFIDGVPAAGARVFLGSASVDVGEWTGAQAVSGAAGHFDFGVLPVTNYLLIASAPGTSTATYEFSSASEPTGRAELFLTTCEARVAVRVVDSSGGAVERAVVVLAGLTTIATSDSDGRFDLCVGRAGLLVGVRAEGYAERYVQLTPSAPTTTIALVPACTIEGRLTDERGEPLSDALVGVRVYQDTQDAGPWLSLRRVVTRADGRFVLDGLGPTAYVVQLHHALSVDADPGELVMCRAGEIVHHDIATRLGGYLHGTILVDGAGLPRQAITWRDVFGLVNAATTDSGEFDLGPIRVGERGALLLPGFEVLSPLDVEIRPGVTEVIVKVRARPRLTGRITRRGLGVAGAAVHARCPLETTTTSHADGSFELQLEYPGVCTVMATSPGATATGRISSIDVGPTGRAGVEVVLDSAASIAGTVVDRTGAPVVGAEVIWQNPGLADAASAFTNERGEFRVGALVGGFGAYQPMVRVNRRPLALLQPVPVTVAPDAGVSGVALRVDVVPSTISGRVTDTAGGPAGDASLVAGELSTVVAVDGTFTLEVPASGTFDLIATGADGSEAVARGIAPGNHAVALTLLPAGSLRVIARGMPPTARIVAVCDADRATHWATGNDVRFPRLPPGTCTIVGAGPADQTPAIAQRSGQCEVVSGEERTFELSTP